MNPKSKVVLSGKKALSVVFKALSDYCDKQSNPKQSDFELALSIFASCFHALNSKSKVEVDVNAEDDVSDI